MNLFLRQSNERYDEYVTQMLNEGSMLTRDTMIEFFRENGFSLSGAKGTTDTILLIIKKFRREKL